MLTLVATYLPALGASEAGQLELARGLPGGVVLACPEGPLAERARAAGMSVVPIRPGAADWNAGIAGRLASARSLAIHGRDLRRLVREIGPDLLVACGLHTALAAPGALSGMSERPGLLSWFVDFLPGPPVTALARAAAARADRVVASSQAVARDVDPDGTAGDRLVVVAPGVDLARYDRDWGRAAEPEVLVLGELSTAMLPDMALEVVALAAREVPELRATFVGAEAGAEGARLADALRRRAAEPDLEGRVTFAGHLADPREAISRAWCLLSCAPHEAFDPAVLQALASGRPVVAARGGAPGDVVDESCGRLYPPADTEAAGAALVEIVRDPALAERLESGARARAAWFEADEARGRFAEAADAAAERTAARPQARPRSMADGAALALVTVTHNSTGTIERLLDSVERYLPEAHMIVVDSGSSDDSVRVARAAAPRATVVDLRENVGFGRASNAGVDLVDRPVTVLINPDAELVDGSLADLGADLLEPGQPERLLAPLVMLPDGSRQDNVHLDPDSPLRWAHALLPPAALPPALRQLTDPSWSRRRRPVGWAVGACVVAATETLRKLGPFDERIFMFSEDLDLGLRAADTGIETVFRPDARVVHISAHSTDIAYGGEPFEIVERQRRSVIGERRGDDAAQRDDRIWALTYMNRILLKKLTGRPATRERLQLAALRRVRDEPARLDPPTDRSP